MQGIDAVLVWAYKALQTERTRYLIYTWDYGNEIATLTGSDYPDGLKKSEAQRFIKECLEVNEYITEVKDIKVEFENNKIAISCTIVSIYGEVILNV